jgi:hypothetical protein
MLKAKKGFGAKKLYKSTNLPLYLIMIITFPKLNDLIVRFQLSIFFNALQ